MRSFREYIREELADTLSAKNAVDYKIRKENKNILHAYFDVEEEPYEFVFLLKAKDEEFSNNVKANVYEVEFAHRKKGYGIIGTGNVNKVFSTAFALLKYAIKKYDSDIILFDASVGRSRNALYKRFSKEVEKLLSGYEGMELKRGQYAIAKKSIKEKVEANES